MIEMMVILGVFLAWVSIVWFAVIYSFEGNQVSIKLILGVVVFVFTAWILSKLVESKKESPCVEYETILIYNAATKTMLPVRSCKKTGEWVKE